jgi:nicotinate-nucleotide pyrophosphorylase (carboxylating)
MIKDNHISVAGGVTNAVKAIKPKISSDIKIEVETTTLDEVKESIRIRSRHYHA